ncbi:hypothetical protein [Streptomyces sp. NPDC058279]|uniref:hypothetical protein n=1 Tax=Streptomyces sp. NPDC058279 TaxID=3346418 RepID=UPI0036E45221
MSTEDAPLDPSGVNALLLADLGNRFEGNTPPPPRTSGEVTSPPQEEEEAPKPSKFTVLLSPDEAANFDELALEMRRVTGRRVEKAEILRVLIELGLKDLQMNPVLGAALRKRRARQGA